MLQRNFVMMCDFWKRCIRSRMNQHYRNLFHPCHWKGDGAGPSLGIAYSGCRHLWLKMPFITNRFYPIWKLQFATYQPTDASYPRDPALRPATIGIMISCFLSSRSSIENLLLSFLSTIGIKWLLLWSCSKYRMLETKWTSPQLFNSSKIGYLNEMRMDPAWLDDSRRGESSRITLFNFTYRIFLDEWYTSRVYQNVLPSHWYLNCMSWPSFQT